MKYHNLQVFIIIMGSACDAASAAAEIARLQACTDAKAACTLDPSDTTNCDADATPRADPAKVIVSLYQPISIGFSPPRS